MSLVDREAEIARLRQLIAETPALVVLRGRRRVGKTYLLQAALPGPRLISFQADQQAAPVQLALFAQEAGRLLPGSPRLAFRDWDEALDFLATQAGDQPLAVVLDEFQYLCAAVPALPSILQRHWDRWQRESVLILLVVCGSAMTFMEGLLTRDAPLYGRATYRPVLQPLDFRSAAAFAAPSTAPDRLIERYAVLGGTPQYQVWAGAQSPERIIKEVVLGHGAPLYEEPLAMLRGEEGIREPATYFGILLAVAQGDTSTSRIAGRLQIASSVATRMLDRLRDLGYLELRAPIAVKPQPTRSYWRIRDCFFRFWFRYVLPNRSRLERGLVDDVYQEIRRDLPTFVGLVFEDCCREWTGRDSPFAGQARAVGSWWSRKGDSEIDVVTMDKDRYLLLGSCKWTGRDVDEAALDDLYIARADLGPKAAQARLALFARRGFSPVVRERAEREHVMLVTAADLFTGAGSAE